MPTRRQKQKEAQRKKYYPYEASPKKHPVLHFFSRHCKVLTFVMVTVVCVFGGLYENAEVRKLQKDIEEQTFVTYTGAFDYDRPGMIKDSYWATIRLTGADGSVKTVLYPDRYHWTDLRTGDAPKLDYGKYYGTVVYSKNSRIIVYWCGDPVP